jgi:hypothetical protein
MREVMSYSAPRMIEVYKKRLQICGGKTAGSWAAQLRTNNRGPTARDCHKFNDAPSRPLS